VERGEVDGKVRALRERAAATEDAVARKQLELAASSLGEELNRLDALQKRKERLVAQLHAQVALLERARVSLVGAQGGEAKDKGVQAAQLAQRLAALAQEGSGGQAAESKPGPHETALVKAEGDSTKTAG
jgi:peptidoglycan hydrolase CwlO-like protein